jgi:type VI secretion system VgrG family protein
MAGPEFKFHSDALADDYFAVVSFSGMEAISKLYEFEIELRAPVPDESAQMLLEDVLASGATFIMSYEGIDYPIHGMLAEFDERQTAGEYTYYRALLVPRLWQLTLSRNSRVYTDPETDPDSATGLTMLDILGPILDEYQLDYTTGDVTGALLSKTYRCQFNESDFDFISRLLEEDGIFYYFDHSEGSDKIVFSDGVAGGDFAAASSLVYDANPPANKVYESVNTWLCRKKRMPGKVVVESYDYRRPTDNISAEYAVKAANLEKQYSFGENIATDDADRIAMIRAEEIAVMDTRYFGESGVCGLRAGYSFDIKAHRNTRFNDITAYVITEIQHQGQSPDGLPATSDGQSGIQRRMSGKDQGDVDHRPQYANSFTAINSEIQYRPPRTTPVPRFYGSIPAFVYSADDSEYAYVNRYGQYRVTLPFRRMFDDEADRATYWIRMAQPYHGIRDGVSEGMFFPLMHGTEVLLTFVNGDPDRPIISATVPNESAPSLVNTDNSNQTVLSTHGMYKKDIRGGAKTVISVNPNAERGSNRGSPDSDVDWPFELLNEDATTTGQPLADETGDYIVERRYGHMYKWTDGNTYSWDNEKVFTFGNDYEEIHEKVNSADGEDFDMTPLMTALGTLDGDDYSHWEDGNDGLVEKNWGDKCEYHSGRAFNWSGGKGPGGSLQTYSYGNGYTENLLEVSSGTADTNGLTHALDNYQLFGIDPGKSTIEKTFGDTYAFQKGFSAEVRVGNAESVIHGNSKETVHGNADNKIMGATSDMHLGAKSEMNLSAASSMTLGGENGLCVGGKVETALAAVLEFSAGVKIEGNGAAEFELKNVNGKIKLCEMDTTTTASLKSVTNQIKTTATNIQTAATQIKSGATSIGNKALELLNSALTMIN